MVSPDPQPDRPRPRIGDAERDDAVSLLQEHMAAGRLDQTEFTDRMNTALQAKTMDELTPLFHDLPGRRPGQEVAVPAPAPSAPEPASTSSESARRRIGTVILALLWPAAIIFNFATGFEWWWTWLIPVFGSGVIATAFGLEKDKHDPVQRRLDHANERLERRRERFDDRRSQLGWRWDDQRRPESDPRHDPDRRRDDEGE